MSDVTLVDSEQLISDFLHERRLALVRSQETKGLKASGRSAEKLTVLLINPTLGQLIDVAGYFYYQEHGRGPGKSPTFDDIYEWLGLKKYGLNWDYTTTVSRPVGHVSKEDIGLGLQNHKYEEVTITPEERRIQMAWGILTNIRKKGTYTHRNGRTNVLTDAFTKESMQKFLNKVGATYKLAIKTDVVNELRQIQK